jgi:hypothetical protein
VGFGRSCSGSLHFHWKPRLKYRPIKLRGKSRSFFSAFIFSSLYGMNGIKSFHFYTNTKACNLYFILIYYSLSLRKPDERTKEIEKSSCNRVGQCDILIKSPLRGGEVETEKLIFEN